MRYRSHLLALVLFTALVARAAEGAATDARSVTAHNLFGLYPADAFVVTTAANAALSPVTRWYFEDEYIAARIAPMSAEDYTTGVRPFADVSRWNRQSQALAPRPPVLVWLGAPAYTTGARLAPDARSVVLDGHATPFALAPKLALNRSYFDASSAAYLSARPLTLRGAMKDGTFIAHTFWPEDFALDTRAAVMPLPGDVTFPLALRALVRTNNDGGAREPFLQRRLWVRSDAPPADVTKGTLLVIMVNGAQGDDDESWGGHFALGTGMVATGGRLSDVMVNNFYSLDVVSEKGILAGPTPLDHYLGDLNSGQAWYRPSHLIVATLKDPRAALEIQGALNRVFVQFWRHQLVYQHSTMNCASISVDTLRALGWHIPARGPTSRVLGWLGVPYALFRYQSVAQARIAYEYMTEDRTRLFPQAAFEDIGSELLRLATRGAGPADGELARVLANDLLALDYVQIPQLPSSRKFGSWAVVTPAEYYGKVPHDPAEAQIVPVPPRVFPDDLRDADLLHPPPRRSDLPVLVWAGFAAALLGFALRFLLRALR